MLRNITLALFLSCARLLLAQTPAAAPGTGSQPDPAALATQHLQRWRQSLVGLADDWGGLARYRAANLPLASAPADAERVVFFGDSITDMWKLDEYFPAKPYVNRGIGGQTTPQMLVRFRQDVIALHPRAVVILAGTNDIAGNTGPMADEDIAANFANMADLARANGIQVIFCAITPVHNYTPIAQDFFYQRPVARIQAVNRWLKEYCARNSLTYIDYYSAMTDANGLLRRELAVDGLHPNAAGYRTMADMVSAALKSSRK